MLFDLLAVGCGGFIGSILRYLIGLAGKGVSGLPIATLGINVAGCFAIAFIGGLLGSAILPEGRAVLFLQVGLCGGFTTFSTFGMETMELVQRGDFPMAVLYIALSVALGVAACFAGAMAAKSV